MTKYEDFGSKRVRESSIKKVTIPRFIPRPYQLPFLRAMDNGAKRCVLVWHRRAGKEVVCFNWMIKQAWWHRVGTYVYFFPTSTLGRRILWDGANKEGKRFLDYIPREIIAGNLNANEMKIRLTNGSVIQVIGSDQIINVGINPVGCVFSEYSLQDPKCWNFIRPILRENGGWAVFNFTPRGKNHAHDLYLMAKHNPEWFCQKLSIHDTGVLTEADMELERKEGMSEHLIEQEYYCFPKGQHVLTSEGSKDISEIKPNDIVIAHTGRFRKVLKTFERPYKGDLIRIKTYGSSEDIICTPNHPIRIYQRHSQKYIWKQAQFIEKKDRVCFPKIGTGKPVLKKEMVVLLAWYICEGSGGLNYIQFTVGNLDEAYEICSVAKDLGYGTKISKTTTAINVTINDTSLCDFFKIHCGVDSYTKKIPFSLIGGFEDVFFRTLIKGDGCVSSHNGYVKYCYVTTSKTLAYQVQLLAHSLNFTAGISRKKACISKIEGRVVNCAESFTVNIGSVKIRQEGTKLIRSKYNVAACVISTTREKFTGNVYNLEVQFDNSFLIHGRAAHNCNFDQGTEGSYYAKLVNKAELDGRISNVPHDPNRAVDTYWDLGVSDETVILLAQNINNEIHIINMYHNQGEGLSHYAKWLQDQANEYDYVYGDHFAPHDIQVRELGSGAQTRLEVAKSLGIKFKIVPNIPIMEGIELTRGIFPRLWIDSTKCAYLVKALENYHKSFNEKLNVFSDKPVHDWSSHSADCLRYLAVSQNKRSKGSMTEEEAEAMQRAYFSRV